MTRASTYQRGQIRKLLRADGTFDLSTCTIMLRTLDVHDSWIGQSIDTWLSSLSEAEASTIIARLEARLS